MLQQVSKTWVTADFQTAGDAFDLDAVVDPNISVAVGKILWLKMLNF